MRTYRWLTLSAAIVITLLEAWVFTGASATAAASTIDRSAPMVWVAGASEDVP